MKTKILFILILILAMFLRFWDLGKNPPGINLDEAAIGWNAYSVLKTGRDEYGQFMPLVFRSLDDYKPPLYIYMTVPSVAVFGLNEFAVRFPAALMGVMAVAVAYFLAKELFNREGFGLAASFLLALSPWHIQFTRTAYETGTLAFFTGLGFLCFLKGLKNWRWLLISSVVFGLELHMYQAARIFVPIFMIFLGVIYGRHLKGRLVAGLTFLVFLAPVIWQLADPTMRLRVSGTSIFQDVRPFEINLEYKRQDGEKAIFHPTKLAYFPDILKGYLSHLSPLFLFGPDLGPKVTYAPNVGLLNLWELPFLLAGFYYLFKRTDKKPAIILSAWILFAPVPAAITLGLPSSIRTAIMLPALQLITGVGLVSLFGFIRLRYQKFFNLVFVCFLVFVSWGLIFYLHMLFVHAPIVQAKTWYFGYKDIVIEAARLAPNYDRVLVSNKLDQTLNFFQFFLKYDPAAFQNKDGGRITGGFAENTNHLANFYFRQDLNYARERKIPKTLFVGPPGDFPNKPDAATSLKEFYYPSGEASAYIIAGDYQ